MALLIFHLVLSSFTFDGVNVSIAAKILDWNLKRYPNGPFSVIFTPRVLDSFELQVSSSSSVPGV